jgi:hypothetical protein
MATPNPIDYVSAEESERWVNTGTPTTHNTQHNTPLRIAPVVGWCLLLHLSCALAIVTYRHVLPTLLTCADALVLVGAC